MENQRQMANISSQESGKGLDCGPQLMNVIMSRLELISEKGKEKVLEYIQGIVDLEEGEVEFDRCQGKLY